MALPAVGPAAIAQAAGTVDVSLVDSVGQEWFELIGDRDVVLSRIDGIDPSTAAGQEQLGALDVPALLRSGTTLDEVARAATKDGVATLTGLEPGVYLLEVADNPQTRDARVSYAPAVVVLAPGAMTRTFAPKAQVLGVSAQALTACNTPRWLNAAAPGTYVEYDYSFTIPNPSVDGGVGVYEITLDFSTGHTIQWEDSPVIVRAAAAKMLLRLPWLQPRGEETVVKLAKPTISLVAGGKTTELADGPGYTVALDGTKSATFTLTEQARAQLADARRADPLAHIEIRVPTKANTSGPWGTPGRGEVLGTLETTAHLRTDGMDAVRTPVDVEKTSHVNVVTRKACFLPGSDDSGSGGTDGPGNNGPGSSGPGSNGAGGSSSHGGAGQPGGGDGGPGAQPQAAGPGEGAQGSEQGGTQGGSRSGLASTGAGVLGITMLALVLIAAGLVLRRRGRGGAGA
ncbi:hypothetical protein C3E79_09490 [Corynebacterium liangguodongii]|uniref:Uncharacterized protein n=1 Tax=Corynebacterium liangguodongii TaxID=2079535 RepID=A0A2S0WFX3_9CORY|nr:hypothetical protein C3E79_09490 [Corynebacterium liangguodongii]PWB99683.1 hypothetical protein DF219_05270 [Corynebacterium liangguodongii]